MRGKRKKSLKNNNKKRDKKREIEKPKSKTAAKKKERIVIFLGFLCGFFSFVMMKMMGIKRKEKNKRESLDTIQVDQGLHLTDRFRDVIVVRVVDLDRLDP